MIFIPVYKSILLVPLASFSNSPAYILQIRYHILLDQQDQFKLLFDHLLVIEYLQFATQLWLMYLWTNI